MSKKLKIALALCLVVVSIVTGFVIGVNYTIKHQQISTNPTTLESESTYWCFGWHRDSYNGTQENSVY